MEFVNVLDMWELVRACSGGISQPTIEQTLGLNKNAATYHLKKPGFKKTPDGLYVTVTEDKETFLALMGLLIPRAGTVQVLKNFTSYADALHWIIEGCKAVVDADWKSNANRGIGDKTLESFNVLGTLMTEYVKAIRADPRLKDPEARDYILRRSEDEVQGQET